MNPAEHLDDLDRRIIVALQADGRASWTEIAERCDTSVATVARRGQQLLRDGIVRVTVVPDPGQAGTADLFVLRITCEPGTQVAVARGLVNRTDLRFLALVTGSADIIAELVLPQGESLHARVSEEIQAIEGVQRCDTDLTLHVYKVGQDWGRQLFDTGTQTSAVTELHHCDPAHFDEADHKIIEMMRADGRSSFRTIASALGVNESTVRRRFETLHRRGCVSVISLVSARALGFESEIIFYITVEPSAVDMVARKLSTYRGVRYVAAMLNHNALMCEVILPTTDDVFRFTTGTLGQLEGVRGWTASMVLLTFRRGFVETPWWRAQV